ncbi:hypothetical protein E8E14_013004 [Neopestalotiopsis sp. 37M]|nr:hypothetical protein E8E14_013004 [Neopestalotiopsis sp. 37M]
MKTITGLFLLALAGVGVLADDPASDDYTCSPTSPCRIGCCSNSGVCGLGPDFCGSDCISSCDYKSECDPGWGAQWSNATDCPLNVCCSKYGFCGTTEDFCGDNTVTEPSCDGDSASHITVGYYEGWSMGRACDGMAPEDIPYGAYSHLNFAFAFIDPSSFAIAPMSSGDTALYSRLTGLKQLNPILKTYISIGGWSMNDPDQPTATTFSDLAGSSDAQSKFFSSLLQFMSNYGFDGVDIDWEYPVAPERSGKPEDHANYVTFLKNLRDALNSQNKNYGLTITIPSSYWYMKNFDIVGISKIIDWFNLMSYDLHGTWDSTDPYIGPVINAHTNLTEITQSLDLLWRNDIDPKKVVLGLGFYGRSFTLTDPSCNKPGCPFSAGGKPGPCTASAGTLSYSEIRAIVDAGATPELDKDAMIKSITWDSNQWVSYDDQETLKMKLDYANSKCLGGTMVWAATTDNPKGEAAAAINAVQKEAVGFDNIGSAMLIGGCGWTACGGKCLSVLKSVITDSGEKGGFLGDLVQLFGGVLSAAAGAVAAVFTFAASGGNVVVAGVWAADAFLITELGLSAGADALTQSCHNDVKQYCCPPQDPPTCTWSGTAPFCNGGCSSPDVEFLQDGSGDGHRCWTGHKSLCCHYDNTATADDNNQCAMSDGFWDISSNPDDDGLSTDWIEYYDSDEDDDCPDFSEDGDLSRRDLNVTISNTLWERWISEADFSHLNYFEKRAPTRTFAVCDRTRTNRNRNYRLSPYPPVNTLNRAGVRFTQQNDATSCPLRNVGDSNTRVTGLNYAGEHVMEANTPSRSMQAMVDGVTPGGGTLNAGRADYAAIFAPGGFMETPWSQLGITTRTGTPSSSLYAPLGTTSDTANLLILERRLNGLKSIIWRALTNIISSSRFSSMSRTQRIAALNSIVNVFDYLNTSGGTNALRAAHTGMLSVWTDFATAMRAQGVTYDFVGAYRQYMRDHFSEMVNNAATFINNNIQGELTYWASQDAATRYGRRQANLRLQDLRNLQTALATRLVVTFAASI